MVSSSHLSYGFLLKRAVKLALPIVFGNLGLVFMGFFDILMLGKVGTNEVAAAGIANAVFFLFFLFALGVLFAIPPLVAIAVGSGKNWKAWLILRKSLSIAVVMGLVLWALYGFVVYYFDILKQDADVSQLAQDYLYIVSGSVIPMLVFFAFKHYLDGLGRTLPASIITLLALVLNVLLNYVLIYGKLGFEPMGILGAGYATLIVRVLMLVVLGLWVAFDSDTRSYRLRARSRSFTGNYGRKIVRLGMPIGLQFFFEVAAFSFAAIMAGWLGKVPQAAHNVALNLANVTYMGATGMAAAGSILVGNALGAKNKLSMYKSANVVFVSVLVYMSFCAAVFVLLRYELSGLFSDDPNVVVMISLLLVYAAFFQISDGLQSVGMGLLRGIKDVKIPTLIAFFSYWIVGIPVSYVLGFNMGMGVVGIWIGFIVGLSLSAILVSKRFYVLSKKINFEPNNEV